jgi:hypothetical protein
MTTPSDPPNPGDQHQPPGWAPQYYDPNQPQWQQPPAGQPQWQPPPAGQRQWQQPPAGQPQWQQPPAGQPQWQPPPAGQPQWAPPGAQQPPWAGQQPPVPLTPPARKGRGRLVAGAAAAIVVIGGGVATYAAVSSSSDAGGAADPTSAVKGFVGDLNSSDLIGILDDLPPGERDAISKPVKHSLESLKRNGVLRSDADLSEVGGVAVKATGITYAKDTIAVNDRVRIVQLTGGRITLNADLAKSPFSQAFLDAIEPNGTSGGHTSSTVDIGQVVRDSGKPIRIAAQKSGDKWYPSLLYTIADNATSGSGLAAPSAADRVPAVGAESADEAVRSFVDALLQGDLRRGLELLSPDELAVVHDYGKLILDRARYGAPDVQVKDLQFTDKAASDGTRVTVKSIDLVLPDGGEFKAVLDGSCTVVTAQGQTKRLCSSDLLQQIGGTGRPDLTPAQKTAVSDLMNGLTDASGLDTTRVDGRWYLNPVRSLFDIENALLSGLKGDDFKQLLTLINR